MTNTPKYILFFFSVLSVGCAHYSLKTSSSMITVPPFTVEAEVPLDGTQLAHVMVRELELHGLNAKFGIHPDHDVLRCHLPAKDMHNLSLSSVNLRLICTLKNQSYEQHLVLNMNTSNDRQENRGTLLQTSAQEALSYLAPKISSSLLSSPSKSTR